MWKVGERNTMKVACNPKSNFPISIELRFGGPQHTQAALDKSHGMWFDVDDAKYLIFELERAIETLKRATTENDPKPAKSSPRHAALPPLLLRNL